MKECFLVGAYCNTEERLDELKKCLACLRKYDLPILISSHHTLPSDVIDSVNGFVYDSDNQLLYQREFEEYKTGFWYFNENDKIRIDKAFDFHHDYAFWTQLKNGFSLAKNKGYDMVHFLDFDVELDEETFFELRNGVNGYDSCHYPLGDIIYLVVFSCNPTMGLKVTEAFSTLYDYFYNKPGQTNVENVFYKELLNNNAKINLISKNLMDKPNFQNFTSALNYFNNNYFIDNKKLIAGIFACSTENENLYLYFDIIDNSNNFIIYIEYDGEFLKRENTLTLLGKLKNKSINIYANGKLFYTKNIEDVNMFKKMNRIIIK